MKKLILMTTFVAGSLLFTGCENGSAHFKNAQTRIAIDIDCVTDPSSSDISNYITLLSGDTISREDAGAKISVYHDINGNKTVCRVAGTGNAYILR